MDERKERDSNELLNILLIILGILYLLKAILYFLSLASIPVPAWLVSASEIASFGGHSVLTAVLGFWCVAAGIGMFREEEWALGMGLMITSLLVVDSLMVIINWFIVGTIEFLVVGTWITIIVFLIGLLGFFWLLFTTRRYH